MSKMEWHKKNKNLANNNLQVADVHAIQVFVFVDLVCCFRDFHFQYCQVLDFLHARRQGGIEVYSKCVASAEKQRRCVSGDKATERRKTDRLSKLSLSLSRETSSTCDDHASKVLATNWLRTRTSCSYFSRIDTPSSDSKSSGRSCTS